MSYDAIKEGDEVTVYMMGDFQGTIKGTVKHIPQATGECWVIDAKYDVHYVQTFSEIRKAKPNDGKEPF